MKNSDKVVLAIYPNSRGFGYAFLEHATEPRDCGIVTIQPICNHRCLNRIKKFVTHYEPTLVLLQDFQSVNSRKSRRVKDLVNEIITFCQNQSLRVCEYSQEQIQFVFEQFKARTKHEIAKTIVDWLPQFKTKMPPIRKPWMCEDYHMGMFDAIALAITHFYLTD